MTDTNSPGFPGLDFEILIFHDFPGFPWPVRTLFKFARSWEFWKNEKQVENGKQSQNPKSPMQSVMIDRYVIDNDNLFSYENPNPRPCYS